jgi:ABC-2 type transport system ATP-binding protein
MSVATIELVGVGKRLGATRALDGITLQIAAGEMFGVIGPDGAGKTTLLRLICGLIRPDEGTLRLQGVDPARNRRVATSSIGYVSQRFSLYGDLSIDENVEFFARIHGVSDFHHRRTRLLELTGLSPFRGRLADRLYGGMKQKLALACTLVHEPPVLVLDEPTTGVDPVSRREFWKLLAEFRAQGLTIVMATPYLDEAERCGRIALVNQGRLLAVDEPGRLQASLAGAVLEIVASPVRDALDLVRRQVGPQRAELFGDRLHVRVEDEALAGALHDTLMQAGIEVLQIRRVRPSLEDVFIDKTSGLSPEVHLGAESRGHLGGVE